MTYPERRNGNRFSNLPSKPQAPRVKGHDAILKAIQAGERNITLFMLSGAAISGRVVGSDKYTITVWEESGPVPRRRIVYKHAIESFVGEERGDN